MEQMPGNDPMFNYLDVYYDILNVMQRKMDSTKQTASISWDFITQMIPHHQAADVCCYRSRNTQILNTMFSDMAHVSGVGVEQNFLREMIPHHEGAVQMSENALSFCICQSLRPILRNIIATQEQEIGEMEQLLIRME